MKWSVREVTPQEDYGLIVKFASGEIKRFDARSLLQKPWASKLNDIAFFMRAHVEGCSVVWDDDVDIAPEVLYEDGVLLA